MHQCTNCGWQNIKTFFAKADCFAKSPKAYAEHSTQVKSKRGKHCLSWQLQSSNFVLLMAPDIFSSSP